MVEFEIEKTVPTSSSSNAKWLWRWAWCTLPKSETVKLTPGVSPIFPHWLPSRVEGQLTSIIGFTTEDQDFFSCSGICRIGLPKIMWKSHNSWTLDVLESWQNPDLSRATGWQWVWNGSWQRLWLHQNPAERDFHPWPRSQEACGGRTMANHQGPFLWFLVQAHNPYTRSRFTVEACFLGGVPNRLKLGTAWILGAASWPEGCFVNMPPFIWQPSESKQKLKYQLSRPSTRIDSSFKSVHWYITIYSPHLLDWFWFLPTFFTLLFASSLQHRQLGSWLGATESTNLQGRCLRRLFGKTLSLKRGEKWLKCQKKKLATAFRPFASLPISWPLYLLSLLSLPCMLILAFRCCASMAFFATKSVSAPSCATILSTSTWLGSFFMSSPANKHSQTDPPSCLPSLCAAWKEIVHVVWS